MTKDQIKQALISILIGAIVAFLSSLFDGVIHFLRGYGNDVFAGLTSASIYVSKHIRV